MLKKIFFISTLFLISFSASARIYVDVSIIFKKGIDKDLVLVNEFHSQEKFLSNETLTLKMKNGLIFDFNLKFVQKDEDYGPSATVELNGLLRDEYGKELGKFEKEILVIDETKVLQTDSEDGQLIEVTLRPKLKL